jgi:hypothetical protein
VGQLEVAADVAHGAAQEVGLLDDGVAAEELGQDEGDLVHVQRGARQLVLDVLGGHVLGGPEEVARVGERGALGVVEAGDAKVQDLEGLALGVARVDQEEVGGLEVLVDDPVPVGLAQGVEGHVHQAQGAGGVEGAVLGELLL